MGEVVLPDPVDVLSALFGRIAWRFGAWHEGVVHQSDGVWLRSGVPKYTR